MRRPKPTAESKARAERIARALAGMLDEEPVVNEVREPGPGERRGLEPAAQVVRPADGGGLVCPCCADLMQSVGTGHGVEVDQCTGCGAVWLDAGELAVILKETTSEASGVTPAKSVSELRARMATVVPQEAAVRYRECPRCGDVMGRINFGTISGVIVDECKRHGVLLDEGELPAIEAFVQMGGVRLGEDIRKGQAERALPPAPEEKHPLARDPRHLEEGTLGDTAASTIWSLLFGS